MAYAEIYNHKQPQGSLSESPDTNTGVGQSGQQDNGLSKKGAVGLMAAAAFVAPAAKTVFNKIISATGDSRLKRNIARGAEVTGLGLGVYALGWVTVGIAAVKYGGEIASKAFDEFATQEDDRYNIQLRGVRVKSYNAGGDFND